MARAWLWLVCSLVPLLGGGSAVSAAEVRGLVSAVAGESRVVALERAPKETILIQYDDRTVFRSLKGAAELEEGETVIVDYRELKDRNLATSISVDLPQLPQPVTLISRSELEAVLRSGNGGKPFFLADIRTPEEFAKGHIPGAEPVPYSFLEKRMGEQLPEDKGTPLIFYADVVSSGLLPKAVALALKHRYRDVRVYRGGMADWLKSDNLVESTVDTLKSGAQGIIDVRSSIAVAAGHIPEAVNIPVEELEKSRLPANKGVPLVLYGEKKTDVRSIASKVRGWGYRKVSYIVAGIESWQEHGGALQHGPAARAVNYSPGHEAGRLGSEDLSSAINSAVVLVLDVRSEKEFTAGKLPGAVNIPLESLEKRYGELNNKKIIVIHSADGTGAQIAYQFLKDKGYRATYLDASLEIRKDGTYRVKE
jgi:rhodanese-related sulfurtransferase